MATGWEAEKGELQAQTLAGMNLMGGGESSSGRRMGGGETPGQQWVYMGGVTQKTAAVAVGEWVGAWRRMDVVKTGGSQVEDGWSNTQGGSQLEDGWSNTQEGRS